MKILLVGANGTLGQAVARQLGQQHQILSAGRHSGELRVDLTDDASVADLFARTGTVDAVISTTGAVHFGPLQEMTPAQFNLGLQDKLLGQVRLALAAQHHLSAGGSITLTSGIISAHPIRDGVNATAVNAALEGFVRAAALELLPALLANLEWRDDKLRAAIDSGMYATDVAVEAAVAGVPFREAYKAAAAGADSAGQGRTPEGSLAARVSPGSAADLRLDELRARWQALS